MRIHGVGLRGSELVIEIQARLLSVIPCALSLLPMHHATLCLDHQWEPHLPLPPNEQLQLPQVPVHLVLLEPDQASQKGQAHRQPQGVGHHWDWPLSLAQMLADLADSGSGGGLDLRVAGDDQGNMTNSHIDTKPAV